MKIDEIEFPILLKCKNKNFVVLFLEKYAGVVIWLEPVTNAFIACKYLDNWDNAWEVNEFGGIDK